MRISELIKKLDQAQKRYGDLPLSTYAGFIRDVHIIPAKDGVAFPLQLPVNEISLEILT